MKQILKLPHKFPSLNEYTKACNSHWSKGNRLKQDWTDTLIKEIWAARLKPETQKTRIKFTIIEANRRRDFDNVAACVKKFCLDALQKAGIIQGDGQKYITLDADEYKTGDHYEVVVTLEGEV